MSHGKNALQQYEPGLPADYGGALRRVHHRRWVSIGIGTESALARAVALTCPNPIGDSAAGPRVLWQPRSGEHRALDAHSLLAADEYGARSRRTVQARLGEVRCAGI